MVVKSLNDEHVDSELVTDQTPFVTFEKMGTEIDCGFEKCFEFSRTFDPILAEQELLKEKEQDAFLMRLIELYGSK